MLALVENEDFVKQIAEDSPFFINGVSLSNAYDGWVFDKYSLHTIVAADPAPSDKQIINVSVQKIDGVWQYVNELEDIIPLSPDEIREQMPTLSSRQFWLAAGAVNVTETMLLDAATEESARIEISKTTIFHRLSPNVVALAPLMGITPEQLDSLWLWGATL